MGHFEIIGEQVIQFALCITDEEPDLELGKLYPVLPDEQAAQENYLRVIDESGEDYLYPSEYFVFLQLPKGAEDVLRTRLKTVRKLFA